MHTGVAQKKRLVIAGFLALEASRSWAGGGLAAPAADKWWPQWQARISLQGSLAGAGPLASTAGSNYRPVAGHKLAAGAIHGGALLGDYYFLTSPVLGQFRASGGLMVGAQGGAPLAFTNPASGTASLAGIGTHTTSRIGLGLASAGVGPFGHQQLENNDAAVPYLGLGYSGSLWRDSISLTADLGMVSERPGAASQVGKALFGNQGMNQALREMRLSPVLQLGVRYTF